MLSLINYYLSDACQRKCSNFEGQTLRVKRATALVPLSPQNLSPALPCIETSDRRNETKQLNPAVKNEARRFL